MRLTSGPAGDAAKIETVAASRIEYNVAGARGQYFLNAAQQRLGHPAIVQSPPRFDGRHRIARLFGSPFLRLQQVDVPAPRHVERMPVRTDHATFHAPQRHVAVPDWADEHGPIVTGPWRS